MRPIRRILVAIKDPRARTMPAVTKAIELARALRAELHLFHGIATPIYADAYSFGRPGLAALERRTRASWRDELETLAARIRDQGVSVTASADWDFPVAEAIVRRAAAVKADLIVAEPHAGRRVAPLVLHLTDWELLRLSPVPVLLVRKPGSYGRAAILAALDPSHALAKPARLDAEILDLARTVTRALHGKLHAMHAYVPTPFVPMSVDAMSADLIRTLDADARAEASQSFDAVLRGSGIPRNRRHLSGGHPIEAIPDTARRTRSAIVVMGAVSRSGLKRLFIGNTAERVLDRLPCDVLVAKAPRFVTKVSRQRRGMRLVTSGQLPMPY